MRTAIYCRVSTDNQEREGTSLQTQLENCLTYCQGKGYDVAYRFSEAYSGLSLERPELDKLRELVRTEAIDIVVCYSLDRLSRDPVHGVIITQELERHRVGLEAVTETVDSTEVGKLITYIRGFASKLEAEKIRERTVRGRKATARKGQLPGGFHNTYGYDYVKNIKGERQARRIINETEAKWVRQIFEWLVNDGLTTGAIRDKLIANKAPTKLGGIWCRASILTILKNPSYCGKAFAFTSVNRKTRQKPKNEWIEIPGDTTPAIVSQELYEAAQGQLRVNYDRASRNNTKRDYLFRSHIRCRRCGHTYVGGIRGKKRLDDSYRRVYACAYIARDKAPFEPCRNKVWNADKLEALVWAELGRYLSDRDLILSELERQRHDANQLGVFENELQQIERQLRAVDRDQKQLLQWALKGFPESQVENECKRLNKERETLTGRKTGIETQLKASQNASINIPKLEAFIRDIQGKLPNLDFEGKRLALDMLGITVWLNSEHVEVTGTIPVDKGEFATTHL